MDLPDWLDPEAWQGYCDYRAEIATKRKPWTTAGQSRALAKLTRLHDQGYDTTEIIDRSIEAGWLGLFPHKDFKRKKSPRETTVTNLSLVKTSDKESARAHIEVMKARAKRS